jgi:uncharacterized membrane protein YcaP (DUF421 family)
MYIDMSYIYFDTSMKPTYIYLYLYLYIYIYMNVPLILAKIESVFLHVSRTSFTVISNGDIDQENNSHNFA